ncbi:hypothetical protein P4S64_21270 [Vibrio sp. M60_M31a]
MFRRLTGTNNAALVDALNTAGDLARSITFVDETVADEELYN